MWDIDKRELDRHIMGENIHSEELVKHVCPKCGSEKMIPMFFDMGGWFYKNDDDPFCEACQCEFMTEQADT